MGKLFTKAMGNYLTRLMGNYLTEGMGKLLVSYTTPSLSPAALRTCSFGWLGVGERVG